jgi:SAM-dependent methyltransferase
LTLVSGEAAAAASTFLEQFQAVRRADGHGQLSSAAYRALPEVPADDPLAGEWRIRRESYQIVCRRLRQLPRGALRILDVGAGNGWLCNCFARAGHRPVAVDLNVDPVDGLLASRACVHRFPLIQAHFDALPFEPGQFDVVIMNASLHYASDPLRTLCEASRQLGPGGALVVMDSPMFSNLTDGEAMVSQQLTRLHTRYGIANPVRPGLGFLTFTLLHQAASAMGRRARFAASRGPLTWRLRRHLARVRLGRPAAAFGVWATE